MKPPGRARLAKPSDTPQTDPGSAGFLVTVAASRGPQQRLRSPIATRVPLIPRDGPWTLPSAATPDGGRRVPRRPCRGLPDLAGDARPNRGMDTSGVVP